jgi:formate dehydrogenase major subunit
VDAKFPLLLNTGRSLYHFNAGTMTYRTPNTRLEATDALEMSEIDAAQRELREGERVRIISRYGEATLPLHISDRVKSGELFATFHDSGRWVNRLTSPYRDQFVQTPEYKVTAVEVVRAGADG